MKKTYLIAAMAMALVLCQSAGATSYNYSEAMQKSIYFYMQQRTGDLPADNPVIWRDDSCLNDGADVGCDLTGGYLDAGDNVKFGLPMASTIATLSWGVYEYRSAFASAGQLDEALDAIKWGTDYFIKCHTATNEFYYQVGSGGSDHAWWGPVEVIEEVMARPSYKVTAASPGSTVVGATAAALAAASVVLKQTDPAYASICLTHAQQLFDFAYSTKSDAGYTAATGYYTSFSGYWDELSAAATWLYIATGDTSYLATAESCANNWGKEGRLTVWGYKWTHSWDDMHYMAQILLAQATGKQIYIDSIERNLDYWMPGGGVTYTPGGLAWLDSWGALRYAANASLMAFIWADDSLGNATKKPAYRSFAESQIKYILGDNPRSSSYIIGFGVNSPKNPHHRTSHGPWYDDIDDPPVNVHTLFGALVGGPGSNDSYADVRTDYTKNEVACDYDAGLVGALAKMYSLYGGAPLADFPQNYFGSPYEIYRDEYFVRAIVLSESGTSTTILGQLTNRSAWPATVKDKLSYRYFFDLTETFAAGYTASNITVALVANEGATISGPFLWSGNVYYVVLDFTGTKIFPGGRELCEKSAKFSLTAPTDAAWDPTNDWSRQGLGSSFNYNAVDESGKTTYIPVYNAGVRLWGLEPGGESPPPAAPSNLSANAVSSSQINLVWTDNSNNENGFAIERKTEAGGTYAEIATVNAGVTSYQNTGLAASTTYYYRVLAFNASGDSAYSNEASAATQGGGSGTTHVDSITCSTVKQGSKYKGRAVVVIKDNAGNAVSGATVTGVFSGSYSQTLSATTDSTGKATLTTTSTAGGTISFTFCVNNVAHSSLTYDSDSNVETCDSN